LSTQHWLDAFPPPREPHYARLCAYLGTQLGTQSGTAPAATSRAVPVDTASTGTRPQLIDASQLQHIERQLAGYIGPMAKFLVKAAAPRAAGVDDLVVRLASELDTESERREFTVRCRSVRPGA
jgi:hypothetical protein